MRLDQFLKLSRLIPSRNLAKEFASTGRVKINGVVAKSSKDVSVSDEIEISRYSRLTTIRVLKVPTVKQVSKRDAAELYELVSEKLIDGDLS